MRNNQGVQTGWSIFDVQEVPKKSDFWVSWIWLTLYQTEGDTFPRGTI